MTPLDAKHHSRAYRIALASMSESLKPYTTGLTAMMAFAYAELAEELEAELRQDRDRIAELKAKGEWPPL